MRSVLVSIAVFLVSCICHADDLVTQYVVTFNVIVDKTGKFSDAKIISIKDVSSGAVVNVTLPDTFIADATKFLSTAKYKKGYREYMAAIKYSSAEPDRGNNVKFLSPTKHTKQIISCADPESTHDIQLNNYQLHFISPAGWCIKKTKTQITLTPTQPSYKAKIGFAWYQPIRESSYEDFDSRISKEVGSVKDNKNIRRFMIGPIKAVEHISRQPCTIDTYLGISNNNESGELYMITFKYTGTDDAEKERYLNVYNDLIRNITVMQVSH